MLAAGSVIPHCPRWERPRVYLQTTGKPAVAHPDEGVLLSLKQEGWSGTCHPTASLGDTVLSERSQTQKDKACKMPLV